MVLYPVVFHLRETWFLLLEVCFTHILLVPMLLSIFFSGISCVS